MSNYNMPAIANETSGGMNQVSLVTDAFMDRNIFLFGEINEETAYSFMAQMLYLMKDPQEINIYINSPGGEVNAGLMIYDLITSAKMPVNTYCVGMAASMGALLFASGTHGNRYILPHSSVMIHEPLIQYGVGGSASTIKNTAESIIKTRDQLNAILAQHTGKTKEEVDKATEFDHFMTAEEAVEFGLCDQIVTSL
jgi:ATP-dependent Clp protease protease subunit